MESCWAGLTVGTSIFLGGDFNGIWAAIGGIVTAILTSFTFSITATRKRNKTFKRELTFIRDTSINTLNREIPLLIRRLKDAGYSPVFVVDELDKYLDDSNRVEYFQNRISELKHLIADRSFFCFLTDRNYYDYLADLIKQNPYPVEQTLFSRRLFVAYTSKDFHKYLKEGFDQALEEPLSKDQLIELQCFMLLAMFNARFHIGDLKKFVESYATESRDNGFRVSVPDNITKKLSVEGEKDENKESSPYSIQIAMQLAIEYLLNDENSRLKIRIDQEPRLFPIGL